MSRPPQSRIASIKKAFSLESGEALDTAAEKDILAIVTISPNMEKDKEELEELLNQEMEAAETEELSGNDEMEEEKEMEESMDEKVSPRECLLHFEKVRAFCQECFSNTNRKLRVIENLCVQKILEEKIQKRITDYFK